MVYTQLFYALQRRGSERSAQVVLPIIFDAVQPKSVIDVGCGVGTWLAVAHRLGTATTVGLEGAWVQGLPLAHPQLDVRVADLETALPAQQRYDLAVCMEVAEHLSPTRAESFVAELCTLSDHVLFSAAIPWQGGTHHLNERPQSYWATLFAERGYGARDLVRPKVWRNGRVSYWYRQNALLFSKGAVSDPTLKFDIKHPIHFVTPW